MSILSLLCLFSCGSGCKDLNTDDFAKAIADGSVALLDVRTPEEYAAGHLHGASNCDWYAPDFMEKVRSAYPTETPIAVYCRSGKRSAAAAAKLSRAGYTVTNMLGGYNAWTDDSRPVTQYHVETFFTGSGKPVAITLIKHGTLALSYNGLSIHVDPVSGYGKPTDYAVEFPKADVILVTHEHGDHFDKEAIGALTKESTLLVSNARCTEMLGYGTALANGDSFELPGDIHLEAVPAYNYTEGRTQFHPKGRDNGFVLSIDGLKIYIAGDTEDIPEMSELEGIDVALLPVNQPYTMTVDQCVHATEVIGPKVLIPYHFSQTHLSELPQLLPNVKVLLRDMQ